MNVRTKTILLALVVLLTLSATPSYASAILFGGLGGHANGDSTNDGALGTVDQTTGTVTIVGHPAGVSRISGLAFDLNGALFGATQGNSPFPPVTPPGTSDLIRLNPADGSLLSSVLITDGGVAINIADLAFQPGTGALYGIRGPNDGLNGQGELYTINKTTGAATLIGSTGDFFGSIAFAPDGSLYMSSGDLDFATGNTINTSLKKLNPANAAVLTSVSTPEFYGALGIRPTDGVIFGGDGDQSQLFTIDSATGAATLVGNTGRNFVGDIAFQPVPEPATLVFLSLGLVGIAAVQLRSRRTRQQF